MGGFFIVMDRFFLIVITNLLFAIRTYKSIPTRIEVF